MIDYACFCQSKHLHVHEGLNASQIAQTLTRDPRTVAYWLAQEHFRPRKPRPQHSKLDPCKPEIVPMLERYPSSAAQVFQRLREHGFAGGYSLVKTYVRTVRPRRQAAFLRLAFAPGECAQVDWGSFGSVPVGQTQRRLSFFVMVLCYSRMRYVEFTVSQTMEHFLACHQHAFAFFGGIPHKSMVDNRKSAVLKRTLGAAPVFHPTYADFAAHCGFTIAPCNVGKGNEKGRVENGVGYVKKNFLAGLEIPDFSALNPAATHWLETVANVRCARRNPGATDGVMAHRAAVVTPLAPASVRYRHGVPGQSLPAMSCDLRDQPLCRPRAVCRPRLDVENLSRSPVHLSGGPAHSRHTRHYDRFQDVEDPDHPKPLLEQRKKARDHKVFRRFLALSPRAEASYLKLEERRLNPHHHVRKIVALSDLYAPEAVARAMEDAFVYEAFSSEYIANLVEQRARFTPEASALHLTRRGDLLDVSLAPPDLSIYHAHPQPGAHDTEEEPHHG
jgi:transposase